ncbi:MAG: TIGR03435 family protein, partial [Blastocatellia bacterium]
AHVSGPGTSAVIVFSAMALLSLGLLLGAQARQLVGTPQLQFEAASLKPTRSSNGGVTGGCHGIDSKFAPNDDRAGVPLGRCVITSGRLSHLMDIAYGMQFYQITGYPDWDGPSRWDVVAEAQNPATATEDELLLMLRNLLVNRFKLVMHTEKKDGPVYALIVGKNGPKFRPSKGFLESSLALDQNTMTFKNYTMAEFTAFLSRLPTIGRPVLDQTGLQGQFDLSLNLLDAKSNDPGAMKRAIVSWDSVFSDINSQLGLKFKSQKAPIENLALDHAEKPIPN